MTGEVFWMIERAKLLTHGVMDWQEFFRYSDQGWAWEMLRKLRDEAKSDGSDWLYRLTRCEVQ